jgi:hypothetical protein
MLFETLETRALMTYVPGEIPGLDMAFIGEYLPPQKAQIAQTDLMLSAPNAANKTTIGLNYMSQNAASFGLVASDFQHMVITDNYISDGIRHIYMQQTFNGLPIADAHASVHIAANGQVIAANSNFIPNLPHPAVNTNPLPDFSAQEALSRYTSIIGSTLGQPINMESQTTTGDRHAVFTAPDLSDEPINVRLQYVPREGGDVTLGWRINLLTPDRKHWWEMTMSAEFAEDGGAILKIVDWISGASYNVFARPVEDPLDGNRSIAVDPHDANLASVNGWHDANGVFGPEFLDTRGNRVSAMHDHNGDDLDEGGTRPSSPTLDFDFPLDITQHPFTYTDATTTNVFYWGNLTLDIVYNHGFDEVSGNFQHVNFSGQGLGNDRVLADTQDPLATNNAFFGTPPDGQSGFTAYGLVTVSFSTGAPLVPPRDIGLDGTVVAHEFAHGISNRLTGGPSNANALDALQSGGMGEGWGDWLGLVLTAEATDTPDMPRPIGEWATDTVGTGIRRYPYSFDMSVDPLTLGDFNGGFPANEVHAAGEIWASALWDMTQLLIRTHGFDSNLLTGGGGLNVALDLVLLGMKLQPHNPTFTEARDAILAADLALHGGENFDAIWEAFARRGFGLSAKSFPFEFIGNSNSEVVIEAFDRPTPLAQISGKVFQDVNGNARRDAVDLPLQGWTVYVDANNNAQFDVGERNTISGVDGSYSLSFFGGGTARIRQVLQAGFTQVLPANNGAHVITIPGRGLVASNVDFGNRELPGQVSGIKWHDLNADGILDVDDPATPANEGEPGMPGIIIYADLNNDGRIGILEPAAVTDHNGRFTIPNIQPGTNYTIRELNAPGVVQTFPSPTGATAGAHVGVIVVAGQTTLDINFGNTTAIDFGDAPTAAQTGFAASYPVTLAQNGARHGILPGFGLAPTPGSSPVTQTLLVDAENDGQPAAQAAGDDTSGADDESGVTLPGLTPGTTANAQVRVRHGQFTAGLLQGWIDWNRDGDWDDAGEQVVKNLLLREQASAHLVPINVPPGLSLGPVYARFRYGYESNIGPVGPAQAGEVEDYVAQVLEFNPVAFPDCFGGGGTIPGCVPIIIQEGSAAADNVLDVQANDFGTVNGGPHLVPSDFPGGSIATDQGGTVSINPADGRTLLYEPPATSLGGVPDTFQYRVRDRQTVLCEDAPADPNCARTSSFVTVTLHVTGSDPIAVDDTRTIDANVNQSAYKRLTPDLLDNDVPGTGLRIKPGTVQRVTQGVLPTGEDIRISTDGRTLEFRQGTGFEGTVIYKYLVEDLNDPGNLTDDSEAFVTIQVVDFVAGEPTPAASHQATLEVQLIDPITQLPLVGNIAAGTEFLLRVTSKDERGKIFAQSGVETAYLDLLYNNSFAEVVLDPPHPLDMGILFDARPTDPALVTTDVVASPPPSQTAADIRFAGDANDGLSSNDDEYNNLNVVFTSGNLAGRRTMILDYIGATKQFVVSPNAFPVAPSVGSQFRVEIPLYNFAQRGQPNVPAIGSINEVGGAHSNTANPGIPVGNGTNTVFSIRMRAKNDTGAPQVLNIFADPADEEVAGEDFSKVILTNAPNPFPNEFVLLTDEQVFLKADSITVLPSGGGGEGEFSNLRNPLDVNDDSFVSPIDALLVINDLNANGARPINQFSIASSGLLPTGYLDVNIDAYVAPIDALLVINFLNKGIAPGALPEGEGEGEMAGIVAADEAEGESADAIADDIADAGVTALLLSMTNEGDGDEIIELTSEGGEGDCCLPLDEAALSIFGGLAHDVVGLVASAGHEIDPDDVHSLVESALDDFFAELDCHGLFGHDSQS